MTVGEQRWQNALDEVSRMTDKLGMGVDEQIAETVAVLNILDFTTTMSCSGHIDRITGGPYVVMVSKEADIYRRECVGRKSSSSEYKKLHLEATKANMRMQRRLYDFLDDFYKNRQTAYAQRLIVRSSFSGFRLDCQGVYLAHIVGPSEQDYLLRRNQAEMDAFTDFLKNRMGLK